jgi:hypothetical protein
LSIGNPKNLEPGSFIVILPNFGGYEGLGIVITDTTYGKRDIMSINVISKKVGYDMVSKEQVATLWAGMVSHLDEKQRPQRQ